MERKRNLEREQHRLIDRYFQIAQENAIRLIPSDDEIGGIVSDVQCLSQRSPKGSIPYRLGGEYYLPAGFYSKLIRPYLPDSKDAFKPSDDDIRQFCLRLMEGCNIVLYYAFSKTESPGRTGSPDWKVDFAEFEMLKNYFTLIEVARKLELNLKITMVDETPILLREKEILGIDYDDVRFNQEVFLRYAKLSGGGLIYRSLEESVKGPLGDKFDQLYNQKYQTIMDQIKDDIRNGNLTPEILRMGVFIDVLPLDSLTRYDLDPDQANSIYESLKIGQVNVLSNLPSELLSYLISLTAHVKSIMELRTQAGEVVREKGIIDFYPEYGDRIYGGVTRSNHRWSFLPIPTRWNGRTVNPMHGLAVYGKDGTFKGVCSKRDLPEGAKISYLEEKPLFVKI